MQTPSTRAGAGGVERFASTLAEVLPGLGFDAGLVGADYRPRRNYERTIGGWVPWSLQAGRSLMASGGDAFVTSGLLGWGAPRGTPRVHVLHGTFPTHAWRDRQLARRDQIRRILFGGMAEWGASRGAVCVAVSESAAREARRLYGIRVRAVIPNGVDTDFYRPGAAAEARARLGLRADARYALFVGRAETRKGADMIPVALAHSNWRLIVAGPQALPASDHLGVLAPEQLRDAYRAADCVVMPSLYEACSFVVLEALAVGVPVVGTDVGFMPQIVRAVPGYEEWVVSPSPMHLRNGLSRLEAMPTTRRAELTSAARAFVERECSLPVFGARWAQILRSLVSTSCADA